MKNYATIIGENLDKAMVAELNRRAKLVEYNSGSDEQGNLNFHVLSAAVSIYGTCTEDAYLEYEIITESNERTPFIGTIPLKGSKAIHTANKAFWTRYRNECRTIVNNFFTELASWLTFTHEGCTVKDGLLATINSWLDQLEVTDNPQNLIDKLAISSMKAYAVNDADRVPTLLVELTANAAEEYLLVSIPLMCLPCEDNIDSYFRGDSKLHPELKSAIFAIFSSFAKFYKYEAAIVFDLDLMLG